MTISGLRQAWKVLRGIPFIAWRTELINVLFNYLNSLKISMTAELQGKYDKFLGKIVFFARRFFNIPIDFIINFVFTIREQI